MRKRDHALTTMFKVARSAASPMRFWAVAVLAALLVGCAAPRLPSESPIGVAHTDQGFELVPVDGNRTALEPTIAISTKGDMVVCAPHAVALGSDLWVGGNGQAFTYEGAETPVPGGGPVLRSGTADLGGGDCHVGSDESGTLYFADGWLGSISVSASRDHGRTWRGVPVSNLAPPVDRPWVVGGQPGEVYLSYAELGPDGYDEHGLTAPPVGGVWVLRSTDGGMTFPQQVMVAGNADRIGLSGSLARSDSGVLHTVYTNKIGDGLLAVVATTSKDSGKTWVPHEIGRQSFPRGDCWPTFLFLQIAADADRGAYAIWALDSADTGRFDLYFAASADDGDHWSQPMLLADRVGGRVYPTVAAWGHGNVGVAWYETSAPVQQAYTNGPLGTAKLLCEFTNASDADWYLHVATATHPASPADFAEQLGQRTPVHRGPLDRPWADLLGSAFTPDGRFAVSYVSDDAGQQPKPMLALARESAR